MSSNIQEQIAQLNKQIVKLHQQGQYKQAIEIATNLGDLVSQHLGKEHPHFANSLNNLALLYKAMGNYTVAELYHRQALEIRQRILGDKHPDSVTSLNNLALLYKEMGNYTISEQLYRQALEILTTTIYNNNPVLTITLNNLALLYEEIGNYVEAKQLYQQSLEIQRQTLGENHPNFAITLNNLAVLYKELGNYSEAKQLYQQSLEIQRQTLGESHPHFATSLNNLASLHGKIGDYAEAEQLYQQSLEIQRQTLGENHPSFAASLSNLAFLYEEIGNYLEAKRLCQKALEIQHNTLGEEHLYFIISLNDLARLHSMTGNRIEAKKLYQKGINISRRVLGENHPQVAINLNDLAGLYLAVGDYNKVEPLLQQALEIRQNILGKNHPDFATSLNDIAILYKDMGNYTKAHSLYEQVLEIQRNVFGENHPDFAASLCNFATLRVAMNRAVEAMILEKQVETINDQMIGQVFSISSESQRMAHLKTLTANFTVFLSLIFQYFSQSPTEVISGLDLVWRRKGISAEALAAQRDAVLGGQYPELKPKLKQLNTLRMQIAQKSLAGFGAEGVETHQQLLRKWNADKEKLETELARQIPELNLAKKLQDANLKAVNSVLPEGAVLVEFVHIDIFDFKALPAKNEPRWQSARYLVFIVRAREFNCCQMVDLGEAKPIDQAIAKFRASIVGKTEAREFETVPMKKITSNGIALRKAVFDPLLEAIGDCKRLFIAPDGDLTKLPFEVLPTDDNRRLIDDYHISYLTTGRDILRFCSNSSSQPTDPIVAADPDFDLNSTGVTATEETTSLLGRQSRDLDSRELNFKRLTYTETEGKQIAAQLGVEPLLGGEVLESQLKAIRSPRILHIATHGFFLPNQKQDPNREKLGLIGNQTGRLSGTGLENPLLRSGLALAGANTWLKKGLLPPEAEDGILTAEDVSGLDLLDTELVVLSACETGLGEVQTGEGVFGLRRAFVLAGAKTLVMSLWKVPDKQTQELMTDYYHRILAGEARGEALRAAQLEMKKKHPNPYYWGAFICQGNPYPLV